jgi:hypothetical protein
MPAPKDTKGKTDLSTIPLDLIDELLEPTYAEGVIKYKKDSWKEGFPVSVLYSALRRHLNQFYFEGEDYDKETFDQYKIKKHHLGAVIFCCLSIYNSLKINDDYDDRPNKPLNKPTPCSTCKHQIEPAFICHLSLACSEGSRWETRERDMLTPQEVSDLLGGV